MKNSTKKNKNKYSLKTVSVITSLMLVFLTSCSSNTAQTSENINAKAQSSTVGTVTPTPTIAPTQSATPTSTVAPTPVPTVKPTATPTVTSTPKPIQTTTPAPTAKPTTPAPEKISTTVFTTNTGSKYHIGSCRYLSKSKIAISLNDAKAEGLEPCKVCNPPR